MARRHVDAVSLRRIEPNVYEFAIGLFSYSLHFDDGVWFLDQYRKEATAQVVGSFQFESLSESINFALDEHYF
jgi:hypothetical protein